MTDDWHRIGHRQPPEHIVKYGPTWPVSVAGQDGGQPVRVLAQIDTGAAGTGISPQLAATLALPVIDRGEIHEAGREVIEASYYAVRITIPGFMDIDVDVAGLPSLAAPHDLICSSAATFWPVAAWLSSSSPAAPACT